MWKVRLMERRANSPYQGLARFYDQVLGDAAFRQARRRFEWLVRRYGIGFASAADAACGTGTFLRYLGRWTDRRIGIDRSPAMLALARLKNPCRNVRLLCQDMRRMHLPYPVDLLTCHFDALNYILTLTGLKAALGSFRRNLTPGGHLIFDIVTRPVAGRHPARWLMRGSGYLCRWRIELDRERSLRRAVLDILLKGRDGSWRRSREVHLQRPRSISTMLRLLAHQGLHTCGVFDAGTLGPVLPSTRRALFLARRSMDPDQQWRRTVPLC